MANKNSKEIKIALSVIVAIVLLVYGIDFLKGVNLIKPSNYYVIELEKVNGLAISAPVDIDGYKVGLVREMNYNYKTGLIVVDMDLDESIKISKGSYAQLSSDLMGVAKITIVTDLTSTEYYHNGDTLPSEIKSDMMTTISNELMPQINILLPKIDSIVTGLNKIVNNPALHKSVDRLDNITYNLDESSKQLSSLMSNSLPGIINSVDTIATNLKGVTAQLSDVNIKDLAASADSILVNVKSITDKVNSSDNTLGLLLNDKAMYESIVSTVSSADSLMVDLKRSPGRYVQFSVFGKRDK